MLIGRKSGLSRQANKAGFTVCNTLPPLGWPQLCPFAQGGQPQVLELKKIKEKSK
jgi:hypothetical protein